MKLRVVIFSGGRGSGVLSESLIRDPRVELTMTINGYDDGASTGEVRRFLGDALGPSDFRKNASRLARALGTCGDALVSLLDWRLPETADASDADNVRAALRGSGLPSFDRVAALLPELTLLERQRILARLDRFAREVEEAGRPFRFGDCAVGNLVFAGSFLLAERDFNAALDDYCACMGLAPGLIDNVTDGRNAFLIGVDEHGRIIPTEEALVDPARIAHVRDIHLLDAALDEQHLAWLAKATTEERGRFLEARAVRPRLNPRLAPRLADADLIIYAPGTQHSSLFPSYLTEGLSEAIARNLRAIKLLVTNIQTDAEIAGRSAVDLIDRAVYYLKGRGRLATPTPALITHYLMNDPAQGESERPYVPLGQVEQLEDPRLVRIGNYEDGVSGRHDASRILTPFVESLLTGPRRPRIAVLLHDAGSIDKVAQTMVEMVRGGAGRIGADLLVFYTQPHALDEAFVRSLPFDAVHLGGPEPDVQLRERLGSGFDYVALCESSGMYRGEDLVSLASQLALGRLDAVWGSRRLSVRDIEASLRMRYRHKPIVGAIAYVGSHVLSVAYLLLYGRYVADTLSGVKAVRTADALAIPVPLTHKEANHWLLSRLLRRQADLLELPVQFVPLSPERARRTSVADGLQALWTMTRERLRRRPVRADA